MHFLVESLGVESSCYPLCYIYNYFDFSLGDHNLSISEVVPVFGRYIRYYVKRNATPRAQPAVNAFHILIQAEAARSNANLPSPLVVKNKLHQLNNDLRSLFESFCLVWKADEVHGETATKTLQVLCHVLWYIDGSHATLS